MASGESTTLVQTAAGWIAMRFGTNIHGAQMMKPNYFGGPLNFPLTPPAGHSFYFKISQHELRTDEHGRQYLNIGWIAMTFGSDIHVPLRMNCNNFCGPLTFHPAPSSGQDLYSILCFITFIRASAVLCVSC